MAARKLMLIPKYILYSIIATSLAIVSSMELFSVKFIEQNDSRLIATGQYNYAITSPKLLAKNWRTVSVNGDEIFIITSDGKKLILSKQAMSLPDVIFIESLRDEIANSNSGFTHYSSTVGSPAGGGNVVMSSSTTEGFAGSTSSLASTSGRLAENKKVWSDDMNVNMRDENNFSVAKSDLPYAWSRVFFNGDLVTFIYKSAEVKMQPIGLIEPEQSVVLLKLKQEVKEMQRRQTEQFSDTMQQSMDMVSNVFNNIMGNFPRPPSYNTIGDMFGNNFPFGPNNSPFSAASGWPFAGAFSFAG